MTLTPAQLLEWLTDRAQQQRNEARSFENAPWAGAASAALFCRGEADTMDALAALLQHVEALEAQRDEAWKGIAQLEGIIKEYEGMRASDEAEVEALEARLELYERGRFRACSCVCHEDGEALWKERDALQADVARLQGELAEARQERDVLRVAIDRAASRAEQAVASARQLTRDLDFIVCAENDARHDAGMEPKVR
jgi:predicted  nucleic acid-binding Zn-ribbon protein